AMSLPNILTRRSSDLLCIVDAGDPASYVVLIVNGLQKIRAVFVLQRIRTTPLCVRFLPSQIAFQQIEIKRVEYLLACYPRVAGRSEEHTSELQSRENL